ncbi:uncharacterized protein K02A2.6-like [Topomyia yanbarensis]|uniref:uncharacterized protein K02A2.6-like n=1 Tax=Topomyia yanbarensis TaxID=2498891 RepID=UPI00273C7E9E|nr:uncharacterized protein K02A2.6-like [Topomyia yanbarensis]
MKRALKKINKGEPLQETLDVFLATYRATPCGVIGQKSPSEAMFGRQMRTTFDMLRPSSSLTNTLESEKQQSGQFNVGDLVHAKLYKRNDWYWEAGKNIEKVGTVIYNVWLNGLRHGLIRSHINQLGSQKDTVQANDSEESSAKQNDTLLLAVLLDEFNIRPRQTADLPDADSSQPNEYQGHQPLIPIQNTELLHQAAAGNRIPDSTTSRGRPIRLPPRFEHYVVS